MKTGLNAFDSGFGDIEAGKLYCIGCTSLIDRLSMMVKISLGLLYWQSGLAIISLDYERQSIVDELKKCHEEAKNHPGPVSLWVDHQPITTYTLIKSTLERILRKNRNLLHGLIIDNMVKIRADFQCPEVGMRVTANLYLLCMIAQEYNIPVVAFSELYPDEKLLLPFVESEYIEKMAVCHVKSENLPRPLRRDAFIIASDKKQKQPTPIDVPVGVIYQSKQ